MKNSSNTSLSFCTVADKNFLLETITLYRSLNDESEKCGTVFPLHVLCLDETAYDILSKIEKNLHPIRLEELGDPELLILRDKRKLNEFAWTCKAPLVSHLLKDAKTNDVVAYTDSDMYFFADPRMVTDASAEKADWSIIITPHNFSKDKAGDAKIYGIYNAGLIFFKKTPATLDCVKKWRTDCLDWCYAKPDGGKFADQTYLNAWPKLYPGVFVPSDKGTNLGKWAMKGLRIETAEKDPSEFLIEGNILVCYHFHGLALYLNKKNKIKAYPITVEHRGIYKIYLASLQDTFDYLFAAYPTLTYRFKPALDIARKTKQYVLRIVR